MENIKLYKETNDRIADLLLLCEDNAMCLYAGTYIKSLEEKIKNYEDLEEQGKLLKLPCAVGDTVYSFSFYRVYVMHVESFITYEDHIDVRLVSDTPENPFLKCDIDIKELGKRWFLTREEAEAALKELERGKEMSNDLISRSALMQSLRNNVLVDVTPNLEQAIAEQPTADYVDKVIEQLEENAKYFQSEADELAQVGN